MKSYGRNITPGQIAEALKYKAQDVVQYLIPGGKITGNEYRASGLQGGKGSSLHVYLSGEHAGLWKEHNGGNDKYQDLLALWSFSRGISIGHAIEEAKRYLDIKETVNTPAVKKVPTPPEPIKQPVLKEESPAYRYLLNRGLTKEAIEVFKVTSEYNEAMKKVEVVFPYYKNNKHVRTKYRGVEEKTFRSSKNSMDCLYGWQAVNISKDKHELIICEGELDAISFYQYGYNALSIPMGVSNLEWLANDLNDLLKFTQIYICLDMDEAGRKATKSLATRLAAFKPLVMELPYKDANDCLVNGVIKEQIQACINRAYYVLPEKIEPASKDWFVQASIDAIHPKDDKQPGYGLGFNKTDSDVWFRPGELTIWSGINGHGKSTLLNQIMLHQMTKGAKVCMASLEVPMCKMMPRLIRQASGMFQPSPDYIRFLHEWTDAKLWVYNHLGIQPINELLETFESMHTIYGCDVFVIDSLMLLDIEEESLNSQKETVRKLTEFVQARDCHLHLVAHPRKLTSEFQKPNKMDVSGSGHIVNMTDNMFLVFRNKIKEIARAKQKKGISLSKLEEEQVNNCDTLLICSKQRYGEVEDQYRLYYDVKNLRYREYENEPVRPIVEFSNAPFRFYSS
ncbi:hypothetical protein YTPLAS21_19300 [Candidatus Nitrosocosmicus sp.]|nr:hypothetical protein YTPLAS21_19300 [Candidatus Nitrosocosmicus sp.]